MRRFQESAALVVALTAIVVALGGTALAANYVITSSSQIKDGAVASADVKNSSLTGTDLQDGSVASADVKNSSLTGADVKDHSLSPKDFNGSVTGPQGPQGTVGPMGPQGPAGSKGDTGPSDTYTGYSASGVGGGLVVGTTIPPGSYVFQANLIATNTTATPQTVECELASADPIDFSTVILDAAGGLDTQTVVLMGTDTVGLPQNLLTVVCTGTFSFADADLIATTVGTLH